MNTGAEPGKLILSWEFWEFWERLLRVGFAGNLPLGILGNFGNSFKFQIHMKNPPQERSPRRADQMALSTIARRFINRHHHIDASST